VTQVRGFADQNLRDKEHPEAAANRRVSVIVRYQNVGDEPDTEPTPAADGKSAGEHPAESKEGAKK
jgi:hypothetical protein